MTSGNRADEPIVTDQREALLALGGIADAYLFNDRRIAFRTDDSIVRKGRSSPAFLLRRSRGHVPRQLPLAEDVHGVVLGLGGDLKSAPALARGSLAHLLPYQGDLADPSSRAQFDRSLRQILDLYGVVPESVIHDLHPLYHSARWGADLPAPRVGIQHHFAHALSVMAEHGLSETIAMCFDGTGYGTDGTIWGGEFLHATRTGFSRLGSFAPFRLPGGEAAVLHPARIAFALLPGVSLPGLDARHELLLRAMLDKDVNCPVATSLGRIFDAAAALVGLVDTVSYEGEGPIRLEGKGLLGFEGNGSRLDAAEAADLLPFLPAPGDGRQFLIDARPLLSRIRSVQEANGVPQAALMFHEGVALASIEGARRMRNATGLSRLALSGGVFQNVLLRELLVPPLHNEGFEVFLNEKAPPGDGGLSLGQIWFRRA
jgi:hydrogenase maturation protein HypF